MYITGTNCNGEYVVILNRYELNTMIEILTKRKEKIWDNPEDLEDE